MFLTFEFLWEMYGTSDTFQLRSLILLLSLFRSAPNAAYVELIFVSAFVTNEILLVCHWWNNSSP